MYFMLDKGMHFMLGCYMNSVLPACCVNFCGMLEWWALHCSGKNRKKQNTKTGKYVKELLFKEWRTQIPWFQNSDFPARSFDFLKRLFKQRPDYSALICLLTISCILSQTNGWSIATLPKILCHIS